MNFLDANEKRKHGTQKYPIQLYHVDELHSRYKMPLHWHKEFEIIRVSSGKLTLFLDGIPTVLESGGLTVVSGGILHMGEPENCIYDCIVFDLEMLCRRHSDTVSEVLLPLLSGEKVVLAENLGNNIPALSLYADRLFSAFDGENEASSLLVYGSLYCIFWHLYENGCIVPAEKTGAPIKRLSAMTAMTGYIEKHFCEQITLCDLSRETGLSEKYICRFFKAFTGQTPIDYINSIRIENACELLSHGINVTECAYRSGFNDLSYFSKIFRRYKGVSPSSYKKAID